MWYGAGSNRRRGQEGLIGRGGGGDVRLEVCAGGGMDCGGALSDGRGKQGRCSCIRLDYNKKVVVVVGIGDISQFY